PGFRGRTPGLRTRRDVDQDKSGRRGSLLIDLSAQASHLASTTQTASAERSVGLAPPYALLDELEAEFARFDGHPDTASAFAAAGTRARAIAAAAGGGTDAIRAAAVIYAADALAGLKLERALPEGTVADMVSTVAAKVGCSPDATALDLFVRAASNPRVLELPPLIAVEVQMGLLLSLAPVSDV